MQLPQGAGAGHGGPEKAPRLPPQARVQACLCSTVLAKRPPQEQDLRVWVLVRRLRAGSRCSCTADAVDRVRVAVPERKSALILSGE